MDHQAERLDLGAVADRLGSPGHRRPTEIVVVVLVARMLVADRRSIVVATAAREPGPGSSSTSRRQALLLAVVGLRLRAWRPCELLAELLGIDVTRRRSP